MAPLKPDHAADLLGKPIDDLALAFVTPLGADHDDIPALPPFRITCHLVIQSAKRRIFQRVFCPTNTPILHQEGAQPPGLADARR